MSALEEITPTIELLQDELDGLTVRGLRTCGVEQVNRLKAIQEELDRIGASHVAGLIDDLVRAMEADERRAAAALLQAQATLRVFERILTLEVVSQRLELLTETADQGDPT